MSEQFTEDQHRSAAAVSETIKKCNCMPTCSHKFCGCPAHYWEPAWRTFARRAD